MTEAELQRLAEIMTQIAPMKGSTWFEGWQLLVGLLVGVLTGVLINAASDFVRYRIAQREKLKTSRIALYKALQDYRKFVAANPDRGNLSQDQQVWEAKQNRSLEIQGRINGALIRGEDKEYTRIVQRSLFITVFQSSPKGHAAELKAIDAVIRSLEPKYLSVTERGIDEFLGRTYKRPWWRWW